MFLNADGANTDGGNTFVLRLFHFYGFYYHEYQIIQIGNNYLLIIDTNAITCLLVLWILFNRSRLSFSIVIR